MKLIIDIPEEQYRTLNAKTQEEVVAVIDNKVITTAVKNGTPLSESEDCVRRQAVLDLAKFDGRENLGSIIHAFDVEQLPPVTPAEKVMRWIPVNERLPEQDKSGCSNWHSVKVFAQIKSYTGKTEIVKGCFIEFGDVMAFELDEYPLCIPDGWDVITLDKDNRAYNEEYPEEYVELQAWMPLPERYKASPTGEEDK